MELRQLRYFATIVRCGSFHAAARRLFVAQPALSIQVAKLEGELGCRLLERRPSGVAPTAAGVELLRHADGILAAVDAARRAVSPHARPVRTLRIGVPPVTSRVLTVPLLEAARDEFPQVRLEIVEVMTGVLRGLVAAGSVDLALLNTLAPGEFPRAWRLGSEDLHVAASAALAEGWGEALSMAELAGLPLLVSTRGNCQRELLERLAARHGVGLRIAAEVDSTARLAELLERGAGAVVGPRLAFADASPQAVRVARLQGGESAWETSLVRAPHVERDAQLAGIEALVGSIMAGHFEAARLAS